MGDCGAYPPLIRSLNGEIGDGARGGGRGRGLSYDGRFCMPVRISLLNIHGVCGGQADADRLHAHHLLLTNLDRRLTSY